MQHPTKYLVTSLILTVIFATSTLTVPAQSWERGQTQAASVPNDSSASTASVNLDLSSTARSVSASALGLAGSVSINVGGVARMISGTDVLTPAEFMAASQVMNGGLQTLKVGADGNAVRGRFTLSQELAVQITNIVIPQNVKLFQDFGTLASLSLVGDINNSGKIFALSTNAAQTMATFSAQNIYNQSTGVITSVASSESGWRNQVSNLGMTLNAVDNFMNAGQLISAGDLSLSAGGTLSNLGSAQALMQAAGNVNLTSENIVNSGKIASLGGNVNFGTVTTTDLNINNLGGQILAQSGAVNLRSVDYFGTANTFLIGGDVLSQSLNLNTGNGVTEVDVDQLTAIVNSAGYGAHIVASTSNLQLGNIELVDPTFYNSAGNIIITGFVSASEAISIIASGDITANPNGKITASGGAGVKNITVIAGALITPCGSCTDSTDLPAGGHAVPSLDTVTVNVLAGAGGDIDFTDSTQSTIIQTTSGNVTLAAVGGSIYLPASGLVSASSGNVLLVSGANTGTGIEAGPISASGSITLITSPATTDNGLPLQFQSNGSTVGNHFITSTIPLIGSDTDVHLAGTLSSPTAINIVASGNITQSGGRLNSPNLTLKSTAGNIGTSDLAPLYFASSAATSDRVNLIAQASGSVWLNDPLIEDDVQFSNAVSANISSAGTSFSLTAMDEIVSAVSTLAVASPIMNLTSVNDNVGTNGGNGLEIASNPTSPGVLHLTAHAGATVGLVDRLIGDTIILEESSAGLNFNLAGRASITAHDISAYEDLQLFTYDGTIEIVPEAKLISGGFVIIQVLNTNTGAIAIGENANIITGTGELGNTSLYIGIGQRIPPFDQGVEPANVDSLTSRGGQILWGQNGLVASAPSNLVVADAGDVIFDDKSSAGNKITLGGGTIIAISQVHRLDSLDLTDPTVVGDVLIGQTIHLFGGALTVSEGVATGGTLILTPENIGSLLSAFNIPQSVAVTFNDFQSATPLVVELSIVSSTTSVVINGEQEFVGTTGLSHAVLNIASTLDGTALNVGTTGVLSSDGILVLNINGGTTSLNGLISGGSTLTIESDDAVTINGLLTSSTSASVQAIGNIGGSGKISSPDISLFSTGGNVGTSEIVPLTVTSSPSIAGTLSLLVQAASSVWLVDNLIGDNVSLYSEGIFSTAGTSFSLSAAGNITSSSDTTPPPGIPYQPTIASPDFFLKTTNGNIGENSSPLWIVYGPIQTGTISLVAQASDSVWIIGSSNNIQFRNIDVAHMSSAGSSFSLTAPGAITSVTTGDAVNSPVIIIDGITLSGELVLPILSIQPLVSLDLTIPSVVQTILGQQNLNLLGGDLIVNNGVATGGNVLIQPANLKDRINGPDFLHGFSIPNGVTVQFDGFNFGDSIVVQPPSSFGPSVVINGTVEFNNSPNASIGIGGGLGFDPRHSRTPSLIIGPSGTVTADGNLHLGSPRDIVIYGNIVCSNSSSVVTLSCDNEISLRGNIGSSATNFSLWSDKITQRAGTLTAASLEFFVRQDIGAATKVIKTTASSMTINGIGPSGVVYISNTGALDLTGSLAFKTIRVLNIGDLTVNNLSAGDITLSTTGGALHVADGASVIAQRGSLILQNADKRNGTITIGQDATLSSSTTRGRATVTVAIGALPLVAVKGITPLNVQTTGKSFYYGKNSITALAPNNLLTSNEQSIVFNTGRLPATAITLNGGVQISATKVSLTNEAQSNESIVDTSEYFDETGEVEYTLGVK